MAGIELKRREKAQQKIESSPPEKSEIFHLWKGGAQALNLNRILMFSKPFYVFLLGVNLIHAWG